MKNDQPIIEFLRTFGAKKDAAPAQIALALADGTEALDRFATWHRELEHLR